MIIRVAKKQTRFSVVDNTGFEDRRLSFKAKGVLAYCLTKPDNWEVRMSDLQNHAPDGVDSIRTALNELRRYGYANIEFVRGEGGKLSGKQWVIYENGKSPISGKTELRKNRLSEKPTFDKSPDIVNTDSLVNTDKKVNTEVERDAREKSFDFENQKKEKAPPIPGGPPATTFAESIWAKSTTGAFAQALHEYDETTLDADAGYYKARCRDWSAQNPNKPKRDWIAFAAQIISDDRTKQKLVILQPSNHANGSTATRPGPADKSDDTTRLIERSRAIAQRLGYKVG